MHHLTKRFSIALCMLPLMAATHAAALQGSSVTWPAGSTIYFYNGSHPDEFNQGSEGWILAEMSMLGASGLLNSTSGAASPASQYGAGVTATAVGTGDGHGSSPGSVLNDSAGAHIGYANAAADAFAFDLDRVSMADMLALLPNLSRIVIAKHGYEGGVFLDGGESFPGFTGEPYPGWGPPPTGGGTPPTPTPTPGNPYPLPSNGNYEVYVNSCNSEDGSPSACGTARTVTTGTVTGNMGLVRKGAAYTYMGPSPFPYFALRAMQAGFSTPVNLPFFGTVPLPDIGSFLGSLSFDEFGDFMRTAAATVGTQITVRWDKTPEGKLARGPINGSEYLDYVAFPPHYYLPPTHIGVDGGILEYGLASPVRPIDLLVPSGALVDGSPALFLDFRPHPELVPVGFRPATQFVHVDYYALHRDLQFARPATLTLHLDTPSPSVLFVARVDENTGEVSLMDYSLGADGTTCKLSIDTEGTYVAVTTDDDSLTRRIIEALFFLGLI